MVAGFPEKVLMSSKPIFLTTQISPHFIGQIKSEGLIGLKKMGNRLCLLWLGASLIAQLVKNPPTMQKMQVQSHHWENSLGKSMVTHSSILAWRIPWTEEPAAKSLQSCPTLCDPLDGSPLGSPVPGIVQARLLEWGAIAFIIHKVTKSWTWLKQLSTHTRIHISTPTLCSTPVSPAFRWILYCWATGRPTHVYICMYIHTHICIYYNISY